MIRKLLTAFLLPRVIAFVSRRVTGRAATPPRRGYGAVRAAGSAAARPTAVSAHHPRKGRDMSKGYPSMTALLGLLAVAGTAGRAG